MKGAAKHLALRNAVPRRTVLSSGMKALLFTVSEIEKESETPWGLGLFTTTFGGA